MPLRRRRVGRFGIDPELLDRGRQGLTLDGPGLGQPLERGERDVSAIDLEEAAQRRRVSERP